MNTEKVEEYFTKILDARKAGKLKSLTCVGFVDDDRSPTKRVVNRLVIGKVEDLVYSIETMKYHLLQEIDEKNKEFNDEKKGKQ